jgi:hypothetical protein
MMKKCMLLLPINLVVAVFHHVRFASRTYLLNFEVCGSLWKSFGSFASSRLSLDGVRILRGKLRFSQRRCKNS